MYKNISIRTFSIVLPATAVMALFILAMSAIIGHPAIVIAQEPSDDNQDRIYTIEDLLTEFGVGAAEIIQANNTFTLVVEKRANVTTVDSGDQVTFTVTITNQGPDEALGVFFYDEFPAEMTNVNYSFSASAGAVHNEVVDPKDYLWLLGSPIPKGSTVIVTITGKLVSARNVTVTNVAKTYAYGDPTTIYQSATQVGILGYAPDAPLPIYLPMIFKAPPPPPIVLAYHEDFNSGNPWLEFSSNGCKTDNRDDRYWVDLDQTNRTCFPPAKNEDKPEKPYRTYGEFEVTAYHSEDLTGDGAKSNAAYGIFINGEGGDNYYLFRIWPNNGCSNGGDWQLIRRKSGNSNTILQGSCHTAIKRGGETNLLRVAHSSDRKLTAYVNGAELGSYTDSPGDHRTGTATGVYVRSADEDVRIKFDDFKVYKYQ
jgi:uncharacterized repeat protein (TIGR01451 family)